jgi:XTP/dITP diphosphohydrolase
MKKSITNNNNWVLASNNKGKIEEINALLNKLNINIKPQAEFNIPEIPETATTFIENALIKARHACSLASLPALADDSGLVVPALGGEPGLYSARYAGTGIDKDNNDKLIEKLKKLELNHCPAYFYCVLVLLQHPTDPSPMIAEGFWHGEIILTPRGTNGFGYNPIFLLPELQLTVAELSLEQKNQLSHRAQALKKLMSLL